MINECGDLVSTVAQSDKGAYQSIAQSVPPNELKYHFSAYPSGWEVLYGHAYEC